MPERPWAVRLGRLLPADVERDLYTPALHDLNAETRSRVSYAIGVVATRNARGALAAERRTSMSAAARRAAPALVVTEVALALMLLIAAGLTLRSFSNLSPPIPDSVRTAY